MTSVAGPHGKLTGPHACEIAHHVSWRRAVYPGEVARALGYEFQNIPEEGVLNRKRLFGRPRHWVAWKRPDRYNESKPGGGAFQPANSERKEELSNEMPEDWIERYGL